MPAFNGPPRFPLGQVVATPGALAALSAAQIAPQELLGRHVSGNWGELCEQDREDNEAALLAGRRLLSAYTLPDTACTKVWIITEADRSTTTLLLPADY